MKVFKNLSLIAAAALITVGANAQTSTTQDTKTQTTAPVMKDKTKVKERPNGTTKTVVKSKPTNKVTSVDSSSSK